MSDVVMKQESTLTNKTTPTMTDLLRLVGSDDHSYKALVSDVAKAIIETYAGSTVAGSAQSVKSALDALNSKETVAFTADTSVVANNSLFVKKVGNVVIINGYITLKNAGANDLTIGTLPAGSRPGAVVRIPAIAASAAYYVGTPAYVVIGTGGNVNVSSTHATYKVIYLSASYIAEN